MATNNFTLQNRGMNQQFQIINVKHVYVEQVILLIFRKPHNRKAIL